MTKESQPHWLEQAWGELGVLETAGSGNNARVLAYYADVGHGTIRADSVAWCAAFLGATLERAGVASTRSLLARSYLRWGVALDEPRLGAIAVFTRGDDPAAGHVGFWIGETGSDIILLGGNQSDAVSVAPMSRARLLGYRWPRPVQEPKPAPSKPLDTTIFDVAFAHVLDMEGGWTDDPYDPGGPTNLGITLSVYAAYLGRSLVIENRAELLAALRGLTPELARDIYITRYWRPSSCPALPPALAILHFDTAVNHGVGNAIRFLQTALGVDVDGEIGPITLGAAARSNMTEVLQTYAELRRERYRALPHFWRFGRGWLRRVDATLALARRHLTSTPTPSVAKQEDPSMTTISTGTDPAMPKWWGHSMTIWGTLITALSTVLPVLGPLLGLDLTPEIIKQLGDQVLATAQAVAGLAGTILAILGRVRATQPLMRRHIAVSL
jgi:uncharacterized protein (TIGR02594 family)